jgi:hypothetical protein
METNVSLPFSQKPESGLYTEKGGGRTHDGVLFQNHSKEENTPEVYLKIQFVPRSKPTLPSLREPDISCYVGK